MSIMRLTEQEKDAIIGSVETFVEGKFELRLYGSRAREGTAGGDIDILILTEKEIPKNIIRKIKILIKDKIGYQQIDIVNSTFERKDSFVKLIETQSIILWERK